MNAVAHYIGVTCNRYGLPRLRPGMTLRASAAPLQTAPSTPVHAAQAWWQDLAPPRFPDCKANHGLWNYEQSARAAFQSIVPVLQEISTLQHTRDFAARAQQLAQEKLGFNWPAALLDKAWLGELNVRRLYAHALYETFKRASIQDFTALAAEQDEARRTREFFLACGFHSVDISPCADGRLHGLVKYILRLPKNAVQRAPYAGALFDVEESLRRWVEVEHARYRSGAPNAASEPTRYLKIAVYHWSSSDPHEGCAAHGSDQRAAAQAALDRLVMLRDAVQNSFCCGASVATLLLGVNTDNDALRVHLPDQAGEMSLYRYVDNEQVYAKVSQGNDPRAMTVAAIEQAIAAQGWGQGQGRPDEGMLRLICQLLENNLKQRDYVDQYHGGRYADTGHNEWFISAGNGFADLPLRNAAYYAHLDTVEEGAADMDVGIKIFNKLNVAHGLPVPVMIHARYNAQAPGARARALCRALSLKRAMLARYAELARQDLMFVFITLQDQEHPERTEFLGWSEEAA